MKFGTVINCIDGRIQYPVLDYLKTNYNLEFIDAINEAGPLRILTERTDKCRLFSLKEKLRISMEEHGSRFLALAGHHDCSGNPETQSTQEAQIDEALQYLQDTYGNKITYVGLYVNGRWEVEEYIKIEPRQEHDSY